MKIAGYIMVGKVEKIKGGIYETKRYHSIVHSGVPGVLF